MFCLALVDFGRWMFPAIALANAVRTGAEYGATRTFASSTYASWQAGITSRVNADLADVPNGWMTDVQVTIATTTSSNNLVNVNVAAEGTVSTIVAWPFLSTPLRMRRVITMRQYR